MDLEMESDRLRKATCAIARRVIDDNGMFDAEMTWAIGVLSAVSGLELFELLEATEVLSRVKFEFCGEKKIDAIKIVRKHMDCCGLKEAKEIVEGLRNADVKAAAAHLIKEECERDCGSVIFVSPWKALPPVVEGRGLDLSDDDMGSDIPF